MFFQPEPAVKHKLLKLHPCPAYYGLILNLELPYIHNTLPYIVAVVGFYVKRATAIKNIKLFDFAFVALAPLYCAIVAKVAFWAKVLNVNPAFQRQG